MKIDGPCIQQAPVLSKQFWIIILLLLKGKGMQKIQINFVKEFGKAHILTQTAWKSDSNF